MITSQSLSHRQINLDSQLHSLGLIVSTLSMETCGCPIAVLETLILVILSTLFRISSTGYSIYRGKIVCQS